MKRYLSSIVVASFLLFGVIPASANSDKKFVKEAASGGMMEVQVGQMAQNKAQSQDVKDFGKMMVTDHQKANDDLKRIAQQKKMSVPEKMDRKQKKMMDDLGKLSGADFDKQYMRHMVMDHIVDIAVFQAAAQKVKDPDLRKFAADTVPTLEQHLIKAREVAQKVGVDVNKANMEGKKEADKKAKRL